MKRIPKQDISKSLALVYELFGVIPTLWNSYAYSLAMLAV